MAHNLTLGEYVVVSGSSESHGWESDALRSFCTWLASERLLMPYPLHVWERYHYMWATGQSVGTRIAHVA